MISSSAGRQFNYIPSATFMLPVDKNKVLQSGIVAAGRAAEIDSAIVWKMGQEQIYKDELVVLDILAHNNWERPMYYTTPRQTGSVKLDNYLELQGLSYRLIPVKSELQTGMSGMVNTDIMYENLMNKFRYTNLNNPKVYQDETCRRMMQNMKNNFNRLAAALISEGKPEKAAEVLMKLEKSMPMRVMGYTSTDVENANLWYLAGNKEKGREVSKFAFENIRDNVDYYLSLPAQHFPAVSSDFQFALGYELRNLLDNLTKNKEDELAKEVETKYNEYYGQYMNKVGGPK
jgi:hypothetical protein